jgi:hypothetical protein
MSLAKPRSRKGGQEWVLSASQRLSVSARKSASGASKPQRLFSRRARGEREEEKALQTVSFAPSRLCERTGFCRISDRKRTHVSREAAKPQRRAGMGFLRVSASQRENRLLVLRSHKDCSLAEHAENAEEKRRFKRVPSRLRVFARGPAFVVFPTEREPMSLAKPRSRKGGQEWVSSASQRLSEKIGFWCFEATRTFLSQSTRRTQRRKGTSNGFLRAFASWRETWVFFLLKKPKGRSSRQDAKTRREAFEALFPLRALRENDTCRLSQPRAV